MRRGTGAEEGEQGHEGGRGWGTHPRGAPYVWPPAPPRRWPRIHRPAARASAVSSSCPRSPSPVARPRTDPFRTTVHLRHNAGGAAPSDAPQPTARGQARGACVSAGTECDGYVFGDMYRSFAHRSPPSDPPRVTFRRVVVLLRGPGQSPVLPFACCVGSLRSVGRCGQYSCWCRCCVRGAPSLVCRGLCWRWRDVPFARQRRPVVGVFTSTPHPSPPATRPPPPTTTARPMQCNQAQSWGRCCTEQDVVDLSRGFTRWTAPLKPTMVGSAGWLPFPVWVVAGACMGGCWCLYG